MRRVLSLCGSRITTLLLVTFFAATALPAAVYLEKRSHIVINDDDSLVERVHEQIKLESDSDLIRYSKYLIVLDKKNRTLNSVEAFATLPGGKRVKVKKSDHDTIEYSGSNLYDTRYYHSLSFRSIKIGTVISVKYEVAVSPYFKASQARLLSDIDIQNLDVKIEGGKNFRFQVDGNVEGLKATKLTGGVHVTGRDLAGLDPPDYAPDEAAMGPLLRYAWDDTGDWAGVGAWYTDILQSVPRKSDSVRKQASALFGDIKDPRERLEVLLAFMRRQVRYESVQIGIGGYQPSAPEDVLERKWGDCKDKGLLLIDLLNEAGIKAYPVLISAGRRGRIEPSFPSHTQFNHFIVAVPVDQVDIRDGDPINEGYLFLDPTQTRGGAGWLAPSDQDQDVLIVRDGGGILVKTPLVPEHENRELHVELDVDVNGTARGSGVLTVRGSSAAGVLASMEGASAEKAEEEVRSYFQRLLPGVHIERVTWEPNEGVVPEIVISASLILKEMVNEGRKGRSFRLPPSRSLSKQDAIKERQKGKSKVPIVVDAGVAQATWTLRFPLDWCPVPASEIAVENAIGRFSHEVRPEGPQGVIVERETILHSRWVEPNEMASLYELAEQKRLTGRRIYLECE